MKRENDKSLSEIEEFESVPFSKDLKRENSMYPGDVTLKAEEEQSLSVRLTQNRENFVNWANTLDAQIRDESIDLKELQQDLKIKYSQIPNFQGILNLYEKDIQKMLTNKSEKKNWNEDDIMILIWIIVKYCRTHDKNYKNFEDQDWNYISNLIPGKSPESAKFKWLQMLKCTIQVAPWTKEENQILIDLVEQKGRKAWQDISKILYTKSNTKTYRSSKQCREHYNNHLDPNVKKGTWSKEEDYELLKLAKEKGKKWSEIARLLNGRTENSVKNRYHALFRKEIEKNEDFLMKQQSGMETEDISVSHQCETGGQGKGSNMINKLINGLEQQLQINVASDKNSQSEPINENNNANTQNIQQNQMVKQDDSDQNAIQNQQNLGGQFVPQNMNQIIQPMGQTNSQPQIASNGMIYPPGQNMYMNVMAPYNKVVSYGNIMPNQMVYQNQYGQVNPMGEQQQQQQYPQVQQFNSDQGLQMQQQQVFVPNQMVQQSSFGSLQAKDQRENYQQQQRDLPQNRSSTCSIESHVKQQKSDDDIKNEKTSKTSITKKLKIRDASELTQAEYSQCQQALFNPTTMELYVFPYSQQCLVYTPQQTSQIMNQNSAMNTASQQQFNSTQFQPQPGSNNQIQFTMTQPKQQMQGVQGKSDISIQSQTMPMMPSFNAANGIDFSSRQLMQTSFNSIMGNNNINTQSNIGGGYNSHLFDSQNHFDLMNKQQYNQFSNTQIEQNKINDNNKQLEQSPNTNQMNAIQNQPPNTNHISTLQNQSPNQMNPLQTQSPNQMNPMQNQSPNQVNAIQNQQVNNPQDIQTNNFSPYQENRNYQQKNQSSFQKYKNIHDEQENNNQNHISTMDQQIEYNMNGLKNQGNKINLYEDQYKEQ